MTQKYFTGAGQDGKKHPTKKLFSLFKSNINSFKPPLDEHITPRGANRIFNDDDYSRQVSASINLAAKEKTSPENSTAAAQTATEKKTFTPTSTENMSLKEFMLAEIPALRYAQVASFGLGAFCLGTYLGFASQLTSVEMHPFALVVPVGLSMIGIVPLVLRWVSAELEHRKSKSDPISV